MPIGLPLTLAITVAHVGPAGAGAASSCAPARAERLNNASIISKARFMADSFVQVGRPS